MRMVPIRIAGRMSVASGLSRTSPRAFRGRSGNAARYRERAELYDKRLVELDTWVKQEIAKVPVEKRKAITGHDSFRYFAAAYGVQF